MRSATSGLPPTRLELEITEALLLDKSELVIATLHALRALGVRISMDDFGTGYSSLSYLRSFPFDKIKIDRSFVHDIGANADSQAIVRAIVSLGDEPRHHDHRRGRRDRKRSGLPEGRRLHRRAGLPVQQGAAAERDPGIVEEAMRHTSGHHSSACPGQRLSDGRQGLLGWVAKRW